MTLVPHVAKRCKELDNLGLFYNGSDYMKDDINVNWTEIVCSDDVEWTTMIDTLTVEVKRRKAVA